MQHIFFISHKHLPAFMAGKRNAGEQRKKWGKGHKKFLIKKFLFKSMENVRTELS